jgi:hypothetical protein
MRKLHQQSIGFGRAHMLGNFWPNGIGYRNVGCVVLARGNSNAKKYKNEPTHFQIYNFFFLF